MRLIKLVLISLVFVVLGFERTPAMADDFSVQETATLGGGCFWCLEAVFQELEGVSSVKSGYSGGRGTPSYKEVCSGTTGHAEVVQVVFDPEITTFDEILAVFFTIHDPTTLNRQGADVGTQYRSVIFYHSAAQKAAAESVMEQLIVEEVFSKPVVTQLTPLQHFYQAEAAHQDYYSRNRAQGYCRAVIDPKVKKFRQKFSSKRKNR